MIDNPYTFFPHFSPQQRNPWAKRKIWKEKGVLIVAHRGLNSPVLRGKNWHAAFYWCLVKSAHIDFFNTLFCPNVGVQVMVSGFAIFDSFF